MTTSIINGAIVPIYPLLVNLPISAPHGSLAVVEATDSLYEFNGSSWIVIGPGGGGGGGTVTSVGLTSSSPVFSISGSPVTTSGNLDIELAAESANVVLAGPSSGGSASPTFRQIVLADLSAVPLYTVNEFLLSPTDITNKFVTLTQAPANPSLTNLDVIGGVTQHYSADFTVSGSTLSWSGLFLDGVLISGDTLIVQFY